MNSESQGEPSESRRIVEGDHDGAGLRFGIVAALFNRAVVDPLVDGAERFLARSGVLDADVTIVRVPGAFEIPHGLQILAESGRCDGLIALGAVIRGDTPHFDYVCTACTDGCLQLSLQYRLPIGFGLLTCDTGDQARARAGGKAGNKGEEAAEAALRMVRVGRQFGSHGDE
jgi:6,7-dimethyl-8-ribityllumazine synthase